MGRSHRTTEEVLKDHLRKRSRHQVEDDDPAGNYAEDVMLPSCTGRCHGHQGVRESAEILHKHFPHGIFNYEKEPEERTTHTAHGGNVEYVSGTP